jgi:hypothetical protein
LKIKLLSRLAVLTKTKILLIIILARHQNKFFFVVLKIYTTSCFEQNILVNLFQFNCITYYSNLPKSLWIQDKIGKKNIFLFSIQPKSTFIRYNDARGFCISLNNLFASSQVLTKLNNWKAVYKQNQAATKVTT